MCYMCKVPLLCFQIISAMHVIFNCFALLAYGLPLVAIANFQIVSSCLFDVSCVFRWSSQRSRIHLCHACYMFKGPSLCSKNMFAICSRSLCYMLKAFLLYCNSPFALDSTDFCYIGKAPALYGQSMFATCVRLQLYIPEFLQ